MQVNERLANARNIHSYYYYYYDFVCHQDLISVCGVFFLSEMDILLH